MSASVTVPGTETMEKAMSDSPTAAQTVPHTLGILITLAVFGLGIYAGVLLMNQPENYGPGVALIVLLVVQLVILIAVFAYFGHKMSKWHKKTTEEGKKQA